ncbi:MAG TPA: radical SAM protein [Methanoregulaceae archaeon]|nr:radical SAM protein [Methanoregulaceae archaeon]
MRHTLSPGCILCHEGAKMVLFLTGTCSHTCWYCPLSKERKGHDRIYANELMISDPDEAVKEALRMSALGTGITGGEPLEKLERVVRFSRRLKEEFGPAHQIHLYTSIPPTDEHLRAIKGLVDEIRLHPPRELWDDIVHTEYMRSARAARKMGFVIGIEVPALPGLELLEAALPELDFLNINELEWGESNADEMRRRGFELEDGAHNAVLGAKIWAHPLIRHQKVHWCSSQFKDSVQLRKRLLRIARNTARSFDEVTEDGTIIYGALECGSTPPAILDEIDDEMYELRDGVIEMAWWILIELGDSLSGKKSVIERYPDHGIIVEVTPV